MIIEHSIANTLITLIGNTCFLFLESLICYPLYDVVTSSAVRKIIQSNQIRAIILFFPDILSRLFARSLVSPINLKENDLYSRYCPA